jgi:hypothetical protein
MTDELVRYALSKWALISANLDVFAAVAVLAGIGGYLVSRWYYSGLCERIDLLKDRNADLQRLLNEKPIASGPAMSAVSPPPDTISLDDAARQAFSETQGTRANEMALSKGGRSENIVTWYANAIARRIPIFGTWEHAAVPSELSLTGHFLGVEPGSKKVILMGKGELMARRIHVRSKDLPTAIASIRTMTEKDDPFPSRH